jgi:hypothetical protein
MGVLRAAHLQGCRRIDASSANLNSTSEILTLHTELPANIALDSRSSMDENRNLGVRKHFNSLTAKNQR